MASSLVHETHSAPTHEPLQVHYETHHTIADPHVIAHPAPVHPHAYTDHPVYHTDVLQSGHTAAYHQPVPTVGPTTIYSQHPYAAHPELSHTYDHQWDVTPVPFKEHMVLPATDLPDHKAYHPVPDPHLTSWIDHKDDPVHKTSDYHVHEASLYHGMPTYYDAHTAKDIHPQLTMDMAHGGVKPDTHKMTTGKPTTSAGQDVEWIIDGKGNIKKVTHQSNNETCKGFGFCNTVADCCQDVHPGKHIFCSYGACEYTP